MTEDAQLQVQGARGHIRRIVTVPQIKPIKYYSLCAKTSTFTILSKAKQF